ncbi:MAG: hypothetical protein IJH13_01255 [Bacilli bacterium]|nr:hypothetical protein [Bacilli bacterium]
MPLPDFTAASKKQKEKYRITNRVARDLGRVVYNESHTKTVKSQLNAAKQEVAQADSNVESGKSIIKSARKATEINLSPLSSISNETSNASENIDKSIAAISNASQNIKDWSKGVSRIEDIPILGKLPAAFANLLGNKFDAFGKSVVGGTNSIFDMQGKSLRYKAKRLYATGMMALWHVEKGVVGMAEGLFDGFHVISGKIAGHYGLEKLEKGLLDIAAYDIVGHFEDFTFKGPKPVDSWAKPDEKWKESGDKLKKNSYIKSNGGAADLLQTAGYVTGFGMISSGIKTAATKIFSKSAIRNKAMYSGELYIDEVAIEAGSETPVAKTFKDVGKKIAEYGSNVGDRYNQNVAEGRDPYKVAGKSMKEGAVDSMVDGAGEYVGGKNSNMAKRSAERGTYQELTGNMAKKETTGQVKRSVKNAAIDEMEDENSNSDQLKPGASKKFPSGINPIDELKKK